MQTVDQSADAEACDPRSDGRLLQLFIRENNAEAFAILMNRHGSYILGVCRRSTTHAQDAEDVFQACFLELVRRASSITRGDCVVGWLQTVAVRLARRATARRTRQKRLETNVAVSEVVVCDEDISWREVKQLLDEEIARLPEELRSPVILCLFEGRTQDEAAQYLEINARTLKARVARGRQQLRERLTRRGVSLAVMGAVLSGSTAQAVVPATLHQTTRQGGTAVLNKTAMTGIVSPAVLGLIGSSSLLAGWGLIAWTVAALLVCASGFFVIREQFGHQVTRQTVTRTFRGARFDNQFFEWAGPKANQYGRLTNDGLRINIPAENGPPQPIGIKVRPIIRGDFELEAAFELLQVSLGDASANAGVTLYFFMDNANWNGVWFGKMIDRERGAVFVAGHRVGKHENRITQSMETVAIGDETGVVRLKVVRRKGVFRLSATHGDRSEFQHVATFESGADELQTLRFATDWGWNPSVAMEVRLLEFSITADEFVGFQP